MKIININNKIISVLGMPHSGTTILCNTLNSMENGFCLSEPHWALQTKPFKLRCDKAGRLHMPNADSVFNSIKNKVKNDKMYDFGGVKETYRPRNKKINKYLDKTMNESDIVFFIFREPKALMNNFKKISGGYMPIERLLFVYNKLIEASQNCKNAINIILEDYCDAGNKNAIQYLNSRSSNLLKIEGEFNLKPTSYIYGDPVANSSKHLKAANRNISQVTKKEKEIINKELFPKYQYIRKI